VKKTLSVYCIAIAILNVFFGVVISWLSDGVGLTFDNLIAGALPPVTNLFFSIRWFPYGIASVAVVILVLSLRSLVKESILCHAVYILLIINVFLMFGLLYAYCLPMIPMLPLEMTL